MRTLRFSKIAMAAVLVSLAGAQAALAVTTRGSDRVREWDGVQVAPPDIQCTSSSTFDQMPGMALRFVLKQESRIVVQFQGQFGGTGSSADGRAVLRFTVDGATVGSAVAIGNDVGEGLETFGYNAFSTPLAPGGHVVRVLWHTFPVGATTCVEERSLIVLHR
jgi:hypothetical protein